MAMINKELYDALLEANISEEKATAAARSLVSGKEDTADLKARLAFVEESRSAGKKDIADIKKDTSGMKVDISNVKTDISNMKADISNMKADISNVKADISDMKVSIAGLEARIQLAEKLQWAILISVIGIIIKDFIV